MTDGLVYLPVLWCRERIETDLDQCFPNINNHLPVLWCRERIETLPDGIMETPNDGSPCTLVQGAD